MGDDDVICLSSDDEVAHDESPRKKANMHYTPLTAKIEPKDNRRDSILCYRKRKSPDNNGQSISNVTKKQKVNKTAVEEIIIESPSKNEVTRSSTKIRDHSNELSVEILRDKVENGTISINKVTLNKTAKMSKSTSQSKSTNSKTKIPPVRNDLQKQLITRNSIELNGKNTNSLKLHTAKKTSEHTDQLPNPVAKFKDRATSRSSSSNMLQINHQLFDGKNETLTSMSSELGAGRLMRHGKLENIMGTVENPTAAANETDKHLDWKISSEVKSVDSSTIRLSSDSPEVLILPKANTPKASRSVSDKSAVKALSSNSSNDVSNLEGKTLPNTENCTKSHISRVTNSQILDDNKDSPLVSTSEIGDTEEPPMKSDASGSKIHTKNDKLAIRRIKPQKLSETKYKSDQSNPNTEKTSKSVESSATHNLKECDSNTPIKQDCSSKNASVMPNAGCSKTPDKEQTSCLKRKSTSPEFVENAKKKKDDASKFEPQPGCSKSPDKIIDGKPRLVVFDKKPVSLETEDTFSMFLSLCLQTDRSLDMDKVVAKLKRYYEQLNPAYAASQAFRDTLNEKRDLIMRKGKKVVYHYVQLLKEDMKAKKKIVMPLAKIRGDKGAVEREDEMADAGEEEEDTEEDQRVRHKIKRIEKAMKECQKMIKKYEEAEVDFDDDNNSHYIKLDRFKERMVQLYTQMCKYTHEHPDAGRAYLRPKHLRVTQIPSVDQAINSFINSKLSVNKYKVTKGKSFVDGLIFPDYVDILECVEKVNKEQDMKLGKRAMQNLAEKAFTQMGKHLQEARQNDYWDTFSLNLDNNVDPATSDSDLLEKLALNKQIAEENEKKVFEEFVRRQEEHKLDDKDESPTEVEDEDDTEDEEQEDEEQDNDKKSNRDVESNEEMSIGEDTDRESPKDNHESSPEAVETISEAPDTEVKECAVEDDTEHISKNNNLEPSDSTAHKHSTCPASSPKDSAGEESALIEVILDDVETEDGENEPREEKELQQPLRIRSFAKPPDSWQCSQEGNEEKNKDNATKAEKLGETDQEVSVVSVLPGRENVVQNLTTSSKSIVGVPLNNITGNITASSTTKNKLPTIQSVHARSTSTNNINGQNLRYITVAPGVKFPVQLPPSRIKKNVQTTQIIAVSRAPQTLAINTRQMRLGTTATTSTPVQRPQLQINPRMPLKQTNQVQVLRLSNGKCVSATIGSRPLNTPRYLTIAASPTSIRPVPGALSSFPQFRPAQILTGVNTGLTRPQIPATPRNPTNFRQGVSVTSTPIQRPNNHQQKKVKAPANLSAAQSSQVPVLRVNNGNYIMSSSLENSRMPQQVEQNASQQQQKVSTIAASVKVVNIAGSTTLPVLKLRMNDNVRTVQQEKTNVAKAPRSGDQNQQTSEGGPKRKSKLL